jgi:hypothetical protein
VTEQFSIRQGNLDDAETIVEQCRAMFLEMDIPMIECARIFVLGWRGGCKLASTWRGSP